MKHLMFIIRTLYPNRHFQILEEYTTDEVFNITANYYLYIDDICAEYFNSFQQLEDYILKLYNKKNSEKM